MDATKIALLASIGAFVIGSASVASDVPIPAVANSRAAFNNLDRRHKDPESPEGYSSIGIAKINGIRVAINILENGARIDDVAGAGRGFADVFDGAGHLIRRFTFKENLNSPPQIIEYVAVPAD
ncbi:MAG: hypothetical protein WAU82_11535 [Candidatus Binatus sp.]|uniref:hypothetical protein n=1 Tax=Candidatus Binatus sp. TaxID=2811406 RepID=UPI003BAE8C35